MSWITTPSCVPRSLRESDVKSILVAECLIHPVLTGITRFDHAIRQSPFRIFNIRRNKQQETKTDLIHPHIFVAPTVLNWIKISRLYWRIYLRRLEGWNKLWKPRIVSPPLYKRFTTSSDNCLLYSAWCGKRGRNKTGKQYGEGTKGRSFPTPKLVQREAAGLKRRVEVLIFQSALSVNKSQARY